MIRRLLSVPELGRLALLLTFVALVGGSLWFGYFLRFDLELGAIARYPKAPFMPYLKVASILAATILALCHGSGLFRLHGHQSSVEETAVIARAVTFATGFVLVVTFFFREYGSREFGFSYSRLTFAYFWITSIILLSATQAMYRRWQAGRYERGFDRRGAVLLGRTPSYLADQIATNRSFGLEVLGYVDPGTRDVADRSSEPEASGPVGTLVESARASDGADSGSLERLGGLEDFEGLLDTRPIEEVLVLDQGLTHGGLLGLLDSCERRGIKVRMVPAVYDLLVGPDDFSYVHNVPLFRVDERRYHWASRFTKRVFDIAVSSAALALLWPVCLLIALAIRLESKGNALFIQRRAGENGRPFAMYKFRTMVDDAERRLDEVVDLDGLDQPAFKLADDPRVTRVGKVLRRTSADELPQLWNVLRGDMSLVGPRPEELRVADRYDLWQRRRLKVKPGITGLQQVEARGTQSELNERVRLDVYYIRKQSLLFDVMILLRTIWAVVLGRGAV